MLSFLSHYDPISVVWQAKLGADHEIVVMSCRAPTAHAKPAPRLKARPSPDRIANGDIGEIAVPRIPAHHTHDAWFLRNRSAPSPREFSGQSLGVSAADGMA